MRHCQHCNDGEPATFLVRFIDGEKWYLCAPHVLHARMAVSPEFIVSTTCIGIPEVDEDPARETYLSHK